MVASGWPRGPCSSWTGRPCGLLPIRVGRPFGELLYLRPDALPDMPDTCTVLAMTALARNLISAVTELPGPPAAASAVPRDLALVTLPLHELPRLAVVALNVPLPTTPRLRALCEGFLRRPLAHAAIGDWCAVLGISRRGFTRRFRTGSGLSFGQWRQRACVLAAIPRLLAGTAVTEVALDLGYENPAAFSTMFRRVTGDRPSRYAAT